MLATTVTEMDVPMHIATNSVLNQRRADFIWAPPAGGRRRAWPFHRIASLPGARLPCDRQPPDARAASRERALGDRPRPATAGGARFPPGPEPFEWPVGVAEPVTRLRSDAFE